jgi:hypothetical protein
VSELVVNAAIAGDKSNGPIVVFVPGVVTLSSPERMASMNGRPTPSVISWKTVVKARKEVGSSRIQSIESMFRWSVKVALNQIERFILKVVVPPLPLTKTTSKVDPTFSKLTVGGIGMSICGISVANAVDLSRFMGL